MTSWREYVTGDVQAGPVSIHCDGRSPGGHASKLLVTWWCDERGWQCYAGTARWNPEQEELHKTGDFGYPNPDGSGHLGATRAYCAECGLDVQRARDMWVVTMERVAAFHLRTLKLRDVSRSIGRGEM